MENHVTLVAALNIAFGALGMFIATLAFVVICGAGLLSRDSNAIVITSIVGTSIAVFLALLSIPEIIGGIGLLKRWGWARILVLIIAVLNLVQIPIGTVVGIYTIWVLLNDKTAKMFDHAAVS